jgi:HEAT repeat protein
MKLISVLGLACALTLPAEAQTLYRGACDPTLPTTHPQQGPGSPHPTTPWPTGTPDLTVWQFWWEFNRTPILREHFQERRASASLDVAPTEQELSGKVAPALLLQLESSPPPELIATTLVALAKLGPKSAAPGLVPLLQRYLDDGRPAVAPSAALALGLLGDAAAVPILLDLVADTTTGRESTDSAEVPVRVRVFAATALGTLAGELDDDAVTPAIQHRLRETFEADHSPTHDVQVACLLALGLLPVHAPEARSAAVAWLFEVFDDRARCSYVSGHAAGAICSLLERGQDRAATEAALERFLAPLADPEISRRTPKTILQSCVLALGRLAGTSAEGLDARARAALIDIRHTCNDTQVRNLSLVALGAIGGRPGSGGPADSTKAATEICTYLGFTMRKGRNAMRPWAGLGAGLLARELGEATPSTLIEELRARCAKERTPLSAAYALGAGLSGDPELVPLVLERYRLPYDEETRGAMGLALGLLRAAGPTLLADFTKKQDEPRLQQDLAIALALIGGDEARRALLVELERASTPDLQGALALAIGNLRDRRTIDPLLELASNTKLPSSTRAAATAALGILGARRDIPWHEPLTTGFNHRASTHALTRRDPPGLFLVL